MCHKSAISILLLVKSDNLFTSVIRLATLVSPVLVYCGTDIQVECNASKLVSPLGCQGALISHFLEKPVYFSSVVLSKCVYDPAAMRRAVFERASAVRSIPEGYTVKELRLFQGEVEFVHSKRKTEETRRKEKEEDEKLIASSTGK